MMKQIRLVTLGCFVFSMTGCAFSDDTSVLKDDLDNYGDSDSSTSSETDTGVDSVTSSDTVTSSEITTDSVVDTSSEITTDSVADTSSDTTTDTVDDTSSDTATYAECISDTDCTGQWCDTDNNICQNCNQPNACGPNCTPCDTETPYCTLDGSKCVQCRDVFDCGMLFTDTDAPAPHCDLSDNTCHECVEDAHCRPEVDTADTDTGIHYNHDTDAFRPYTSPVGVCSPDRTCTCWGSQEAGIEGSCVTDDDCPQGMGYKCVQDYFLNNGGAPIYHLICLRECDLQDTVTPQAGLECVLKGDRYVWVPTTSCHAFTLLGTSCTADDNCSVDGSGTISDGYCSSDDVCTYACESNNTWCGEALPTCGTQVPYTNLCIQ